jgi:hypothetical protein
MTRRFSNGDKIFAQVLNCIIAAPTARGAAAVNAEQRWELERPKARVAPPLRETDFSDVLLAVEVVAS